MQRFGIIVLLVIWSSGLFSQAISVSPPEYEKMRLQIFDNTSPFFYPKLFERYQPGDTTLSLEEFRFLYFGYTFQSRYVPYQVSRHQDKMIAFMSKNTLTSKELDEFIKLCKLNLDELPFDIRTLNILAYSYKQKGDTLAMQMTDFKKQGIIRAIKSTGNGLTERTAFHVIDPAHEYDLLYEEGLEYAGSSNMTTGLYDYLLVRPNEKGIRGLYFNISRILIVKTERR
jgi:hypothetical protein